MNTDLKIVAEASVPYLRGVLEELGHVTYLPSSDFTPETIAGAHWLIIRSITRCTRELLEGSSVRLITTATIGYDHIDTAYCEAAGIAWRNSPGCNAEAVGQYIACALATWALEQGYSLAGKTLGIVGVGHVGSVVQRYASALGLRTLLCDPPRAEREGNQAFCSLETLVAEADIITLHTPLERGGSHPTYHLIDADMVAQMRRQPLLINACRGPVIDTDAVLYGLDTGRIGDVIIDCWEGEPHIRLDLLQRAYIATPHIAGFSADGKVNGARMCVEAGEAYFGLHAPSKARIMQPPVPTAPLIPAPSTTATPEQALLHALLHTYAPRTTHTQLLREYEHFEHLRRTYPYPREPFAYTPTALPPAAQRAWHTLLPDPQ